MPAILPLVLAVAACAAPPSWAKKSSLSTPRRAGDSALIDAAVVAHDDMVHMTDQATGVVLLTPVGEPIWRPDDANQIPAGADPADDLRNKEVDRGPHVRGDGIPADLQDAGRQLRQSACRPAPPSVTNAATS